MKYQRKEAIEFLVDTNINDIQQELANNDLYYLKDILTEGFLGYSKLTNTELEQEIYDALEGSDKENEEIEVIE